MRATDSGNAHLREAVHDHDHQRQRGAGRRHRQLHGRGGQHAVRAGHQPVGAEDHRLGRQPQGQRHRPRGRHGQLRRRDRRPRPAAGRRTSTRTAPTPSSPASATRARPTPSPTTPPTARSTAPARSRSRSARRLVWYVDRDAASNGDGRSHSPLQNLAGINGAGGSGDSDTTSEIIFLYSSGTAYTGGLPLEASQQLIGEPNGLVVNATTLVAAGGTNPNVQNAGGHRDRAGRGLEHHAASTSTRPPATASRAPTSTPPPSAGARTISGVTGADFKLSGGNGNISLGSTITNTAGRAVDIQNRTGGITTVSGAISDNGGTGIILNQNSGGHATNFTGDIDLSTGGSDAFTATGVGHRHRHPRRQHPRHHDRQGAQRHQPHRRRQT